MPRPVVQTAAVERGIQRVTRTHDDGRKVVTHRIKYPDSLGKIQTKTVHGGLQAARQALGEARAAVAQNKHLTTRSGNLRFRDVAGQWLDVKASDWKPRTEHANRWTVDRKLKPLLDVKMKNLSYDTVSRFRADLSRPNDQGDRLAPASIKRTMQVLSQICDHARRRGPLVDNPCAELDPVKGRKPPLTMPSTEDIERLVAHLAQPSPQRKDRRGRMLQARTADPRYALLVETAAFTGLRAGELAGLQMRDINFANGTILVERTVIDLPGNGLRLDSPKSDASHRTVRHVDPAVIKRLRAHCVGLSPRDYVFGRTGRDGTSKPLHHGNFYRRILRPAAEELGITMTFHGLRHHAASLWIALGLNAVEVATNLGHSSAAFTLRTYVHLFKSQTRDVGDLVNEQRAAAPTPVRERRVAQQRQEVPGQGVRRLRTGRFV